MIHTRPQSPTMATTLLSYPAKEFESNNTKTLEFPTTPQHERQQPRRVRFATMEENDDGQPAPHKALTAQMIDHMWYNSKEIDQFKQDVRSVVIRKVKQQYVSDDELVGLGKYNPRRSEYKRSALYHILHAQSKSRDPNFIRAVSRRSTAWARAVANEQGLKDYCDVYDPLDDLLDFDTLESAMEENGDFKRMHENDDIQTPSFKRQRLSL